MILVNPDDSKILKQVARIHRDSISLGFLSSLGEDFLFCFYKALIRNKTNILVVDVSEEDGKVRGFAAASKDLSISKTALLTCWKGLINVAFSSILNPPLLKGLFELIRYKNQTPKSELPQAELISIAVDERFRKQKVGSRLYWEIVKFFKTENIERFKIVVGEQLKEAQRFYEKMGAKLVGMIEVHKGRKSYVFVHDTRQRSIQK